MKRPILLSGTFFLALAFGVILMIGASDIAATSCDPDDYQTKCIEDYYQCNAPNNIGIFLCGTQYPGGAPCLCEFSGCSRFCFDIWPEE